MKKINLQITFVKQIFLQQKISGQIYVWTKILGRRSDMVEQIRTAWRWRVRRGNIVLASSKIYQREWACKRAAEQFAVIMKISKITTRELKGDIRCI